MANERMEVLGKIALGLCLAGVVLGLGVGVLAIVYPKTWSMPDAANTLIAAELCAGFMGALSRKSASGSSALIIGGVLALGAWVFSGR